MAVRYIAYSPGDMYAIKRLEDGRHTHTICHVVIGDRDTFEVYRCGPKLIAHRRVGIYETAKQARAAADCDKGVK